MSYCRFSSDDFSCDVYAYEHYDGYIQVHVASNRIDFCEQLPPKIKDVTSDKFIERLMVVNDIVDKSSLTSIGLSRDGKSFSCATVHEAVKLLESLKHEGYRIPDYVIENLKQESEG